jgi:hypothetical protein
MKKEKPCSSSSRSEAQNYRSFNLDSCTDLDNQKRARIKISKEGRNTTVEVINNL